ncbi:hypothetical protein NRK68_01075 [Streptomyces yangpuensis]|uniref:Asp23/Gls24 family envelope stress response protein n=1 Tax=Streptomyces yangpuensis TaxID=1648182 RepID=A0ABY5PQ72_9ACTN|nr:MULTISPECIES: hypothetical protein [Streptomyces]UUY45928.1 hypothetical protein NRK68_01075 [Streptomyces yangpuensis]
MTTAEREGVQRTAARAALGVRDVVALQPALAERLALAACRVFEAVGSGAARAPVGAGVRCEIAPDGVWHLEVRCILDEDHRVVDVARRVRADVKAAVSTYLAQHDAARPLTVRVVVSVTRTIRPAARETA